MDVYTEYTRDQLKKECLRRNITIPKGTRRQGIIELLRKMNIEEEEIILIDDEEEQKSVTYNSLAIGISETDDVNIKRENTLFIKDKQVSLDYVFNEIMFFQNYEGDITSVLSTLSENGKIWVKDDLDYTKEKIEMGHVFFEKENIYINCAPQGFLVYKKKVEKLKYEKMNVSVTIHKGKPPKKDSVTISYADFCKEIDKDLFIQSFLTSLKSFMLHKMKFYKDKMIELMAERDKLKTKMELLQTKGISQASLKEKYPSYELYCCLIADIDILVSDMYTKMTKLTEESIRESLKKAMLDTEKGLASLISRDDIKNSISGQLFSFSKSSKIFSKTFNNYALIGNSGCGKCLAKNTKIIMFDGSIKKVQDIRIGDILMGDDSTPRKVLSTTTGKERMYKIKQEHGEDYTVNESHILSVMDKEFNKYDLPLKDVFVKQNEYFGYISNPVLFNNHFIPYLYYTGYSFDTNTSIPKEILTCVNRIEFLAGIIDSKPFYLDGDSYTMDISHARCMDDILFLSRSLGFPSFIKNGNIYITGNIINIPVKQKESSQSPERQYITKIKIEYIGEGDYYGFVIDGNHRFLLGDFTVTHNTHIAKVISFVFSTCGILSTENVKITSRYDLVATFVGQTSPKTQSILYQTLEGVLFIDEAYQLIPEKIENDYGPESITEIVNFTDKFIGMSIIIVAGYKDVMLNRFFKSNEGLTRRFPHILILEDYTMEELCDILFKMFATKNINFDEETKNYIYSILTTVQSKIPSAFSYQAGDMLNLSSNIEKVIFSSYKIKWVRDNLKNNIPIIKEGISNFLETKGYYIK